jgi:predicted porin
MMMRKLAVLTSIAAFSELASAQSSVTLYGVADDSLTYTNNQNGHAAYQTFSGGLGGSKFGFLGREDLGGGLAAVFRLENGFDMNSGKLGYNGRLFGRQAYMGLASNDYGTLTLGRQYDFMVNLQALSFAQLLGGSLAAHAGDVDGIWGTYPVNNAVKYVSPIFRGLSAGALYSFGGVPGSPGTSQQYGFGANYANGPLRVAAAFLQVNNPAVARFDGAAAATAGGTFVNPVANPIYSGYATARTMRTLGVAANYALGATTFGLTYTNTAFNNAVATSSTSFSGSATLASYEAFVSRLLTTSIQGGVSYNYTSSKNAHYNQVAAGAQYLLSKRTFLYSVVAWQHATGIDSTGHQAVADLTYLSPSSNANQLAVRVGIRHSF